MWCAIVGSPVGILRPIEYPGQMLEDYELGRYRRGFKRTCLYWKKHIIRIGPGKADIRLEELPAGLNVDLVFYRFLDNYVKNVSPRKSELTILVTPSDTDLPMEIEPGKSYRLEDGLKIKVGDYEFRYERLWNGGHSTEL
jgi:hypothetical protein